MPEVSDLGAAIAAQARSRPQAVALVWHDTEVTYGDLLERAEKARLRLIGLNLAPGEPVCLAVTKSPAAVALVLACLLTGRPFLLPSPTLPDEVLDLLAARAGCRTICAADSQRRVPNPGPAADGTESPALAHADGERSPARPAAGVGFMLTTSGSTGLPKVVPLGTAAVGRFVTWAGAAFGITAGTTVLNYAPLNFDLCLLDVWTTLAHGGRVLLVDPDRAADGHHLLDLLVRHRPQVLQAVPMFFGLVRDAAARDGRRVDSVRHVMFTGDAISERVLAGIPGVFPAARRWNIYGCTETNDSFLHELEADDTAPVPIGRPLPGVRAVVVGRDGAVLDGPGEGELYVSTPFQTDGYLTPGHAERFSERPGGPDGHRWFRTGDLVRRAPDGSLTVIGRSDFQVKVRGFAVNTAEVERVLLEHPDVVEVAAVALPDPVAGNCLVATVRRAPSARVNTLILRRHCARRLPRAAIPSTMQIVEAPLPRTSTGKVDRTAVGRLFELSRAEGKTP